MTNNPAYYNTKSITSVLSFKVQVYGLSKMYFNLKTYKFFFSGCVLVINFNNQTKPN
jgi:hypothetical protein